MCSVIGLALVAAASLAVDPPTTPTASPTSPLAGPRVFSAPAVITLVETDYSGRVRRVEGTPEEAALGLLGLTAAERADVERVLQVRARVLDEIVRDNLLLLNKVDTASKAGRKLETLLSIVELYAKFQPIRDRGVLHDEIEAALPAPARGEFNRLLGEYWDAIIAEGMRGPAGGDDRPARVEIVLRERFEIFGRELQRSFKRYEMTAVEDVLDRLLRGLNLSPDQERATGPIVDRLARAIRADAPEQERGVIVLQLMAFLTAEQQAKLMEAFGKLAR
ncbi:MAG: hypothetical protein IT436_01265 [Phycisphaerales bacterium]|nr:hypothetical protein [Phycisphaerales bacterium]